MIRTLLSAVVGVPVALLAMSLLYLLDVFELGRRPRPAVLRLVRASAAFVVLVLLALIAVRFAKYS